jgi:hypothetical protein
VAAPDFVPTDPTDRVRRYSSPPRRAGSWVADRPGELVGGQPSGARLGSQGPDQGYALTLVKLFDGKLHLGRVHHADAVAGCVAVATKRSALFGRAPVVHDLTAAFSIFGFLDEYAPEELVALREEMFAEIHSPHHYRERRAVADLVDEVALRKNHVAIGDAYRADWRSNLAL